jgi:hypothetical protein
VALQNEAWFIHAVDANVTHLAQQKRSKSAGSTRRRDGVVGKTFPFNRIDQLEMGLITTRDGTTVYANPDQSKRRAVLQDYGLAVLIDEFDEIKTLTNPQSEHAQVLAYARERRIDRFLFSVPATGVGGIIGLATTVDEAAETSGTQAMTAANQIANGGTGLTMAKLRTAIGLLDNADVDENDRYMAASPDGILDLLSDSTVTSSDFASLKALEAGTFPMDHTWMGFHWRKTTLLPKTGNIRSAMAWQKNAVGLAVGLVSEVRISDNPERWNNTQVVIKLSAGAVRIDERGVVQIDYDESV